MIAVLTNYFNTAFRYHWKFHQPIGHATGQPDWWWWCIR